MYNLYSNIENIEKEVEKMYRIGICDDGVGICSAIENMIQKYIGEHGLQAEIDIWNSGEKLCEYLGQGIFLDILFLDIELMKLTGVEVGNFIRNRLGDRGMQIVYISGKESYALKLFKTQPLDFLVKPITQSQINEVLELGIQILDKNAEKFEFQKGKDYYYIPYGEILYFTSEGRKIRIHNAGKERKLEFYGKMAELEKNLPKEFQRIHQSCIVNCSHVLRFSYECVELEDGCILPISKTYRKKIRDIILEEN